LWRSARLFILGLVISNIGWIATLGHEGTIRLLGVLQRIAISFLVASLLYAALDRRAIFSIAVALLLTYWGLLFLPRPDGAPTDLYRPAANFVSWVDQVVLGRFTADGKPFDPEGLLSTLPAIAQCLLGLLVGQWMLSARGPRTGPILVGLGIFALGLGLLWTLSVPIVKNLWTPSFVMVSSGVSLMTLGVFYQVLDAWNFSVPGGQFLLAFGMNSIFVYVLHILLMPIISIPPVRDYIYNPMIDIFRCAPEQAVLATMAAYVLFLSIPIYLMYRKNWVVRI
jgi:predicted acyltransferase